MTAPAKALADLVSLTHRTAAMSAVRHAASAVSTNSAGVTLEQLAEGRSPRRWAQLMVALYRDERQAEALDVFGGLRQILRQELVVDPSAELTGS